MYEYHSKPSETQHPMRQNVPQRKQNKPSHFLVLEMVWFLIAFISLLLPTAATRVTAKTGNLKAQITFKKEQRVRKSTDHRETVAMAIQSEQDLSNSKKNISIQKIKIDLSNLNTKYTEEFMPHMDIKKHIMSKFTHNIKHENSNKKNEKELNYIYLECLNESLNQHILNYKYLGKLTENAKLKYWIEQKIATYTKQQEEIQKLQNRTQVATATKLFEMKNINFKTQ
jgi:hypothetical protein